MKTFKSKRSIFTMTLIPAICCGIITVLVIPKSTNEEAPAVIYLFLLSIVALFIWILFDTKYSIGDKFVAWKSGPFSGKIAIASIRKIEYSDSFIKYQTWKPGLDHRGIVLYFNKFDDIFISPESRDEFVETLLERNSMIDVKR